MLVYMIRHGQSTANRDGVLSGQKQWPLSELGIEQARQVGERLRAVTDFDKIYVSDLLRTRQTFEHAFGDLPHTLSPLIREIDIPFAGMSKADAFAQHGEAFTRAMEGLEFAEFGGESQAQVVKRVLQFRSLLEQEKNAQHVAVVCHDGIIRTFMATIVGVMPADLKLRIGNCSVSVFEYRDHVWRIVHFNHTPEIVN